MQAGNSDKQALSQVQEYVTALQERAQEHSLALSLFERQCEEEQLAWQVERKLFLRNISALQQELVQKVKRVEVL